MNDPYDDFNNTPTANEDELDLLAAVLHGADPADVNITADEFDQPLHAQAWQAMLNIANSGGTISPDSLRMALPNNSENAVWVMGVFGRYVVPANAREFGRRVRKAAHLRNIIDAARGLMADACRPEADPAQVAERWRGRIEAPTDAAPPTTTFADLLPSVLQEIETGKGAGLSTPWPELDRKIHGLRPGALYVIGARPGVGKSLMGQNLAWHWSQHHNLPTYFASLEMLDRDILRRTIAQAAKVEMDAIETGHMTAQHWDSVERAMPALTASKIHLADSSVQTVDMIRQGARQLKRRHGLGLIVVDYLQIVEPRDRRIPREQQVADISRSLKGVAKELEVPVVALAQIRRPGDQKGPRPPSLTDLRESGAIEQDADVVALLHIPDENEKWFGELLVAKARSGTRGPISLKMQTKWATVAPDPTASYDQRESA